MDTYYRSPMLHYVTSADDVIHYYHHRSSIGGQSVVDRRGPWTSHRDAVPRQQMLRQAPTSSSSSGAARGGEVWCSRRKLSVDDGASTQLNAAVVGVASRRRPLPTSASDDAPSTVAVEDWSSSRRRLSAWSPLPTSTLSRTLSEHTLDRSVRYRGAGAECRDDLLDEWTVDGDGLESVLSPPRIAPVSGQLSLVCIFPCSAQLRPVRRPITRRSFPREAFPRSDAQGYFSAREMQRAETYPCASSRGNASRGKDRRVIGH